MTPWIGAVALELIVLEQEAFQIGKGRPGSDRREHAAPSFCEAAAEERDRFVAPRGPGGLALKRTVDGELDLPAVTVRTAVGKMEPRLMRGMGRLRGG